MQDINKTIHYTTQAEKICANLIKYIPNDANLIEPFVGNGDLLNLFPNHKWEKYDLIIKQENVTQQDTLSNPPDYNNKWVITNPPYLAKNKANDKTIFIQYNTDDLYKAAMLSLLEAEGGILIIPTNFLTDERTGEVRERFLNRFEILEMNIFTEPVFESTTYSICSFAFRKNNSKSMQNFNINIFPVEQVVNVSIYPQYNYRLAGEFYNSLENTNVIFGRLVENNTSGDFITNIKLYALDTRTDRIRVEYEPNKYIGKNTDRTYATFTCKKELTEEQEKFLIMEFNNQLETFRKQYYDLSMTNYRDYNRKRIGFTFAYQLLSKIYQEKYENLN